MVDIEVEADIVVNDELLSKRNQPHMSSKLLTAFE